MNLPDPARGPELDGEWKQLILEAKKLGLSIDEIRIFLRSSLSRETDVSNVMK